jgi:hypothetical protein
MNKAQKITLLIIFLLGIISPFISLLTVLFIVNIFFIMLCAIIAIIYLVTTFFGNKSNRKEALFFSTLIPFLMLSQLLAVFTVHKIQKNRSETLIAEIEVIKKNTGHFPETYETPLGIQYKKVSDVFEIQYSRGFFVTERYTFINKTWNSFGWND